MKKLPVGLRRLLKTEIDPVFAKRAELIFQTVLTMSPKRLLDAGCGRGFYLKALSKFSSIKTLCGIDLNKDYINQAKKQINSKKVQLKTGNIYQLPYKNNYFDFVIASEVLEHLKDDSAALKELRRVLKRGATLMLTVPNLNFPFCWDPLNWLLLRLFNTHVNKDIWWLAGIWADHERLYTQKQLTKLLAKNGFKISKSEKIIRFCLPFSHFWLYGVGKNLVERLGISGFDRFSNKKNLLSAVMAWLFRLPSTMDSAKITSQPSVGIVITAVKI